MQRHLLEVIACPICAGAFTLDATEETPADVRSGRLRCGGCDRSYPIERGIPRLLVGEQLERTRRGFAFQWRLRAKNAFEPGRLLYGHDVNDLVQWFFDGPFGAPGPGSGGWMLDAGCGSGDKALAAARQHPELQVVAMDVVDTIGDAAMTMAGVPNLHFVQGDVMAPPFRAGCFQRVVSWGVLHHTRSTEAAFRSVARLVAPEGRLLVWIYPHPSEDAVLMWYYRVRDWYFLGMGPTLHPLVRLWLVRLYCIVASPVLFYLYKTLVVPRYLDCPYVHLERLSLKEKYESTCFLFYDCLTPERQFRHRRHEVLQWFGASNLADAATDGLGHYWGRLRPSPDGA